MNSQNEANFVISKIEQNKTAKPLTRATEAKAVSYTHLTYRVTG